MSARPKSCIVRRDVAGAGHGPRSWHQCRCIAAGYLRRDRPPASAEPSHGGLALILSAGLGGPRARLGLVSRLGPAWVSRAGGQIDRYIGLDLMIGARGEGGPVFDAAGGLLGMATAGPDRRGLVIPAATIDRVIGPLLATGRIARGWLGLGMQPIALDDDLASSPVTAGA